MWSRGLNRHFSRQNRTQRLDSILSKVEKKKAKQKGNPEKASPFDAEHQEPEAFENEYIKLVKLM